MAESYANLNSQGGGFVEARPEGGAATPPLRIAPSSGGVGEAGLAAAASSASRPVDPSVMGLLNIASSMLQPKIKEARQQQFMQGVQEAQTGKALTEIIAEQPAYANIFAPSAAAEGARAYTVQAQLAGFAADMENRMPLLAEQDPSVVRQEVFDRMQESMTGDAAADALITQSAVEQFGPMFKRHAKAHYEYLQHKASDAQMNAWLKGAEAFNMQMTDPKTSPEDRAAAGARMLGQIAPFADQPDAAYDKQVATFIDATLAAGNFGILRLFKETPVGEDGGTLWDTVSPDARDAISRRLPSYAQKALEKHMGTYAVDINMLTRDVYQNPALFAEKADALNARIAAETGIHEAKAIPLSSYDNVVGGIMTSQRNAAESEAQRAAVAQAKAAEEAQKIALASQALTIPNAATQQLEVGMYENKHLNLAAQNAWLGTTDAAGRAAILKNRPEGTYGFIRGYLAEAGIGANPKEVNAGVRHVADIFAQLPPALQGAYFSADQVRFYDRFNENLSRNIPEAQAFLVAKNEVPRTEFDLPEETRTAVQDAIRSVAEETHESPILGLNIADDASLRNIENLTMRHVSKYRTPGKSDEMAAQSAIAAMRDAHDLTMLGSSLVMTNPGQKFKPLHKVLGTGTGSVGPEEAGKAWDKLLTDRITGMGGSPDAYSVYRTAEEEVAVMFVDGDYRDRMIYIDLKELRRKKE